ncbi:hypothetical protein ALO97_200175 [Pseudomonas syringae pv. tagetis]|nr:hypothetical protein ALO97_200175 [Pseudomonas syringae pv. tagetis]
MRVYGQAQALTDFPVPLLPRPQNLLYYASLANFYTVHVLRNLKADQSHLYLLCYAWVR